MVYEKHHFEQAPDRDGNQRTAIVFELRLLSAIVERTEEEATAEPTKTLEELRAAAKTAAGIFQPEKITAVRNIY
jgi:5-methylcytosine-specific restriction protein A